MNTNLSQYHKEYENYYKSPSQLIRVVTEHWFKDNMFCPFCSSNNIEIFQNNYPVADFYCNSCGEEFQLKSKKKSFGKTITDGEYNKMIKAIHSNKAPNFFFLSYSSDIEYINNLIIVPKEFILPSIIQKRNPLSQTARRAGWTGCNILISSIPNEGKIYAIKDKELIEKNEVVRKILNIDFIRNIKDVNSRSWLNDILIIISDIKAEVFKLGDIYKYCGLLKKYHPLNNNIEAKIRQQLQILRDNNVLEFLERGVYKKL